MEHKLLPNYKDQPVNIGSISNLCSFRDSREEHEFTVRGLLAECFDIEADGMYNFYNSLKEFIRRQKYIYI
jgi:hypothetical protein